MEILAHSLWAAAAAVKGEKIAKKRISIPWSAFWGIFPDLFAFAPLVTWWVVRMFTGDGVDYLPGAVDVEPVVADQHWIIQLTSYLYLIGHSGVVFLLIFALVCIMQRRIVYSMLGWLLHIVIDLFTHSYETYPSPILFPLLIVDFNGVAWSTGWFMILNYLSLVLVYWYLFAGSSRERMHDATVSLKNGVRSALRRVGIGRD